jgi:hypothetical protein
MSFVSHFFFYADMPMQPACRISFGANSFSRFVLFFGGFTVDDTHILDLGDVISFASDHFVF